MSSWLDIALRDSSQVLTFSRRLTRELRRQHAAGMLASGKTAWRSPAICTWQEWLSTCMTEHSEPRRQPTIITPQQSRMLWERCLRAELADPLLSISALARMAQDSWNRLHEWQVSLPECERAAKSRDQRLFAKVAGSYQSMLRNQYWLDEAILPEFVAQEILAAHVLPVCDLVLAGFDRLTPQQEMLVNAVRRVGRAVTLAPEIDQVGDQFLAKLDNPDAEMRCAGAWARRELLRQPGLRIGIVVTNLEQHAQRSLRMLKEGLIPGWQNATAKENSIVNLSYGRRLSDYPAIAKALLALRWLSSDLPTLDISRLLLSGLFDGAQGDDPTRFELHLRERPDQTWSPQLLLREISATRASRFGAELADRIRLVVTQRERQPAYASPATWASLYDEYLNVLGWPGKDALDSSEFQLVNRWRLLLNDLAHLNLTSAGMSAAEALARTVTIASETIFQPESSAAAVQVLGPLEAAGLCFDKLWVSGLSSANWPPPARPPVLLSRELQREHGMPDSTPADTLSYATRVLHRLRASAPEVILSYATVQDDVTQSLCDLLGDAGLLTPIECDDPGWHAASHAQGTHITRASHDPVPAVRAGEWIQGGAATIQKQLRDPFSAFVAGRLGVGVLAPVVAGLPARVRGTLVHAALHRLYRECPDREQIRQWLHADLASRARSAVQQVYRDIESNSDEVLRRLLQLEKVRTEQLLTAVVTLDAERENFQVSAVEKKLLLQIGDAQLRLRIDRLDMIENAAFLIIDYKTGAFQPLLDRDRNPRDIQLIVYAHALTESVAGIALFNVDSRATQMQAVGQKITPDVDWPENLANWREIVVQACTQLASGDVRIRRWQSTLDARPFALLSRFQELLHEQ